MSTIQIFSLYLMIIIAPHLTKSFSMVLCGIYIMIIIALIATGNKE